MPSPTLDQLQPAQPATESLLVDEQGLLKALFAPECIPSSRWLRYLRERKAIPYLKIGGAVYFDPAAVRAALVKKFTLAARD